jgi:hypothetical protein
MTFPGFTAVASLNPQFLRYRGERAPQFRSSAVIPQTPYVLCHDGRVLACVPATCAPEGDAGAGSTSCYVCPPC